MSEFFEPPPPRPPEPEPEHRQPPWFGPPRGTLPGVVALELVLAQTDTVAVYISQLLAYPTGFGFDLVTVAAPGRHDPDLEPLLFGPHRHHALRRRPEEGLPPEMLRIGVQFADGAKATNTTGFPRDQDPSPPVMHGGGGGGGDGNWHQRQWVWPLPPPGPLTFVCEWPAAGIALTRSEIDAQTILDAATRAQVLFPDQPSTHSPQSGGWTSYAPITATQKPKANPPGQ